MSSRALALAGAGALVGALILVRQINPTDSSIFPSCPFHAMTGLSCPGCGATRGMHQLLNGNVVAAFDYNALLVIFVPMIAYLLLNLIYYALRGRSFGVSKLPPAAIWMTAVVLLTFGVLRNLPFYPFTILAP